jgi:tetratricopeptide (TPR) repeat protein
MDFLPGRTLAVLIRSIHGELATRVTETTTVEPALPTTLSETATSAAQRNRVIAPRVATETSLEILTILRRVAETLAFLHGEGIVHRDLKPSNIFVRADGLPILMDFGLMRRHWFGDREVVDTPARFEGTVAFMAPEQTRGERVDARADLYALGCILYVALTGTPPFVAGSMDELLRLHRTENPVPLPELVLGIPPELADLAARLLAKRSSDRIGYASEVADILGGLGAEGWPTESRPEPRQYLYMPELTGRDLAVATLVDGVKGVARGSGAFVLLHGESGIGKTATLSHVVRLATARGARVVVGDCFPVGSGSPNVQSGPLGPLARTLQTIADLCVVGGPTVTASFFGEHAKVLSPYDPSMAQVPGIDLLPDPPPIGDEAARKRLFVALASALQALAREKPLVLVLDDLHWADELTMEFLAWLPSSFVNDNRVMIVGSFRSEEATPAIENLRSAPHVKSVALSALDAPSIMAMVRGMLAAQEPPTALSEFLLAASGGNPFFVAEYVRTAVAENLLVRDVRGRWSLGGGATGIESSPLPRSLKALLRRRLESVDPQPREFLWLAAALGRQTDLRLLTAVGLALGLWTDDGPDAMPSLKELKRRQILEEHLDGTVSFVHDKLWEVAYDLIPADRRRTLHATIARCLEDASGRPRADETSETAVVFKTLAEHWARAGSHDRAFSFFRQAGNVARAVYSNATAAGCYAAARVEFQRAEDAGQAVETKECREVLEAHGDVLGTTGAHAEAREAYAGALAIANLPTDRARLLRKLGKRWGAQHEHQRALSSYEDAERELGTPNPQSGLRNWWREWIEIRTERMWACYWLNLLDDMSALVDPIAAAVKKYGGPLQRAHFNQCRTALNIRQERYRLSKETLGYARAALSAARRTKDPTEIGAVHFGMAFTLLFSGRLSEAARDLTEGLSEADRLGDVPLILRYLTYLTIAERRLRRVNDVQAHADRLASLAAGAEMFDYHGSALSQQAWVAFKHGDEARALRRVEEAIGVWTKCPIVHPFQWTAHWPGLALAASRGDAAAGASHARALTASTQQRLPDDLAGVLDGGITSVDEGKSEESLEKFSLALRQATEERFL